MFIIIHFSKLLLLILLLKFVDFSNLITTIIIEFKFLTIVLLIHKSCCNCISDSKFEENERSSSLSDKRMFLKELSSCYFSYRIIEFPLLRPFWNFKSDVNKKLLYIHYEHTFDQYSTVWHVQLKDKYFIDRNGRRRRRRIEKRETLRVV